MKINFIFQYFKNNPVIFSLSALILGHLFINYEDLAVEGHSRLQTLTQILDMSHQGFYFQIDKGIPMDVVWEDPLMGFVISLKQLIISQFTSYKISIKTIYYFQFLLLGLVYLKPFLSKIFYLPNYFKFAVPVFFLVSVEQNILFYSYSGYWAQNLFVVSISLYLFSYIKLCTNPNENVKKIIYSSIYTCLLLSILALIRRNIFFEVLLIFGLFFLILFFLKDFRKNSKSLIFSLIPMFFFLISYYSINFIIKTSWEIRDDIYNIKVEKRNPTHPLWVPLYGGLGAVENNLGIKFDDGSVYWDLEKMFPDFEIEKNYGSQNYEKKVKEMYLTTIKQNPELLLNSIIKKTIILFKDNTAIISLIVLMFLYLNLIKKNISINLLSASILFSTSVVPILTSTFFHVSFKSALWFWITLYFFILLNHFYKNFEKFKNNIFYTKLINIITIINSNNLFQSFKKNLIRIALIFTSTIIALLILFTILDESKLVVKKNKVDLQISWTTEENKFYNHDMEQTITDIKADKFNEFKFNINNQKMDLKYLRIKIISKEKINLTVKEINFFDQNGSLIEKKSFTNEEDLNFLIPSNNKKEITQQGLFISQSNKNKKRSPVELLEDISPYNDNIPKNLSSVSIILSVTNDFKPNFSQWLKFLIGYN